MTSPSRFRRGAARARGSARAHPPEKPGPPTTGPSLDGPAAKLREELDELAAEIERAGRPAAETEPDARVEAELGDVLFSVVNLARFLNVDPELALRAATRRSRARIELAERLAAEAGETWVELDLDAKERWYERAKAALGRASTGAAAQRSV